MEKIIRTKRNSINSINSLKSSKSINKSVLKLTQYPDHYESREVVTKSKFSSSPNIIDKYNRIYGVSIMNSKIIDTITYIKTPTGNEIPSIYLKDFNGKSNPINASDPSTYHYYPKLKSKEVVYNVCSTKYDRQLIINSIDTLDNLLNFARICKFKTLEIYEPYNCKPKLVINC